MSGTIAIFAQRAATIPADEILAALGSLGNESTFQSRLGSTHPDHWEVGVFTGTGGATVDASTRPIPQAELDEIATAYADVLSDRQRRALVAASREYRLTRTEGETSAGFPTKLAHAIASRAGGLIQDVDEGRFYLTESPDGAAGQP